MDGFFFNATTGEVQHDLRFDLLNDFLFHTYAIQDQGTLSTVGLVLAVVSGLCIGSFLNVVAMRSLAKTAFIAGDLVESLSPEAVEVLGNKSWFSPFSQCIHCHHRIGPLDNLPVVSYMMLGGKCRHCREPIHWQYPVVEISTMVMFVAIQQYFGWSTEGIAMLVFASTLIAVTVTDFRDHLIPHEITYPSILVGIIYSTVFRKSPMDTLAGIGVAYILFDFIQFYGLLFIQGLPTEGAAEEADEKEQTKSGEKAQGEESEKGKELEAAPTKDSQKSPTESDKRNPLINGAFNFKDLPTAEQSDDERNADDYVVMGGGDAVLAAVVAAWLGSGGMIVAIMLAFLIGALMGGIYLFIDMKQRGALHETVKPAIIGFLLGFTILCIPLVMLNSLSPDASWWNPQLLLFACAGGLAGGALGATWAGSKFRKRFPFGPAIAVGALVAVFLTHAGDDPEWFSKIPWVAPGGAPQEIK